MRSASVFETPSSPTLRWGHGTVRWRVVTEIRPIARAFRGPWNAFMLAQTLFGSVVIAGGRITTHA